MIVPDRETLIEKTCVQRVVSTTKGAIEFFGCRLCGVLLDDAALHMEVCHSIHIETEDKSLRGGLIRD